MKETTNRYARLKGKLRVANETIKDLQQTDLYVQMLERTTWEAQGERDELAHENSALKRRIADLEWWLKSRDAPAVKQVLIESSGSLDVDYTALQ
jgi:hypothetical protein